MKKAISKLLVVLALTFLVNTIQIKAAEMQSLIFINISVAHSLSSKQPITIYEIDNKTNKDIDLAISSQRFESARFLGNREERKSKISTFKNSNLIISKLKSTDITNKIAVYHNSDSNKIDINLYIKLSDNNSFSIKEKDIKEYLNQFKSKQEFSINENEEYTIAYNIESGELNMFKKTKKSTKDFLKKNKKNIAIGTGIAGALVVGTVGASIYKKRRKHSSK